MVEISQTQFNALVSDIEDLEARVAKIKQRLANCGEKPKEQRATENAGPSSMSTRRDPKTHGIQHDVTHRRR